MSVSRQAVAQALIKQSESQELDTARLRAELGKLEFQVELDAIDVAESAIVLDGSDRFSGEATAYVVLRSNSGFEVGEEVPVHFTGTADSAGVLRFDNLEADLSPFAE